MSGPAHRRLTLPEMGLVSRRGFLQAVSAVAGSAALGGVAEACGGAGAAGPQPPPAAPGAIRGIVTDLQGVPQPSLGRLYLMRQTGQQTGRRRRGDGTGRFTSQPRARNYKVASTRAARAHVPDGIVHPIPVDREIGKTADIEVRIQLGVPNARRSRSTRGTTSSSYSPTGVRTR